MEPTLPIPNRVLKRLSADNSIPSLECEDRSRPEQSAFFKALARLYMPLIEQARQAQAALEAIQNKELKWYYHVLTEYMRNLEIFDRVTKTVLYAGAGHDFSSLFHFPNASQYIHLDRINHDLQPALRALEKEKIIRDLVLEKDTKAAGDQRSRYQPEAGRREYRFVWNDVPRHLIEVQQDITDEPIVKELRSDLEAIYFFAVPYPNLIQALQVYVLPHLKMGGVFEGPYPYSDGTFEGAPPEEIGLKQEGGTYVKRAQFDYAHISRTILRHGWGRWDEKESLVLG